MRRPFASVALALLVAFPLVAPAAAGEPRAPGSTPASEPTPPQPTDDPATSPAPTDPAADPSPSVEPVPSDDPAPSEAPARTDEPAPTEPSLAPEVPATPAPSSDPSPAESQAPPAGPTADPSADAHGRPDATGRYIVVLAAGAETSTVITRHRQKHGTRATRTFDRALQGFSASLDADQRRALRADPNVVAIVPDEVIELSGQLTPTGVSRVGAKKSVTAAIDGTDQRVDADVAIVDTGIAKHPDLNVVGGYNCSSSDRTLWRDKQGHGTHVAGTVAALDNDYGVVGVAPGARLWAVKILNDDGYGLLSWYVCGLDWILRQRDPDDASRPRIEAVNMSVAKWGRDDHACGSASDDILHAAICRVVAGGITVVAAAANDSGPASKRVPAAYNEVITVSALADTDGKPGGLGGNRCYSWGTYDKDDTFANFSNYGGDVDIMAPGKCIWSTKPGSTYGYSSGTSMAAPAVTGAVALYKATRPAATPSQVKEALQYLGNLYWATSTDPDSTHEKLLDVSRVAKLGTFGFATAPEIDPIGESGRTVSVPITLTRSSTFFERVFLSVQGVPTGWTATLSTSSLLGWDATSATLVISVPANTQPGVYDLRVTGVNQGRVKVLTVPVRVTNERPRAAAPRFRPVTMSQIGVSSTAAPKTMTMRVQWAAATDDSGKIVAYQVQRRSNYGTWGATVTLGGSARSTDYASLSLGLVHQFRLRAKDVAGNWSLWAETTPITFQSVSDRSSTLTYRGSWWSAAVDSATNRVRTASTDAGATVSRTFTGRGIAVVMPRADFRGKVTIHIDGVKAAVVDTYYGASQTRRVVWSRTWVDSATHTIKITVDGTAGRPTISLDGLIVIR